MATSKLQALWNHPAGPKTSEFGVVVKFCYLCVSAIRSMNVLSLDIYFHFFFLKSLYLNIKAYYFGKVKFFFSFCVFEMSTVNQIPIEID